MAAFLIPIVAAVAGSAVSASAQKKAAAKQSEALDVRRNAKNLGVSLEDAFGSRLEAPEFNFGEADIIRITKSLSKWNAGQGTDLANQSAGKINQQTLDDLETGMRRMFGGGDAFDNQRSKTNQAVEDQLDGKLSQSTRRQLARRSLASGASGVGEGAVDDLYAGYLGLTTEGIVQQGQDNYRSLYGMYKQSLPLVTGAQLLPYTTTTPEAGVKVALQAAGDQYTADLNAAFIDSAPDPVAAGLLGQESQRLSVVAGLERGQGVALGNSIAGIGQQVGNAIDTNQQNQAIQQQNNQNQAIQQQILDILRQPNRTDNGSFAGVTGGTGNVIGGS